jgi:hypothetical protein
MRIGVMNEKNEQLTGHRVVGIDELPESRVKTVTAETHSMALTHIDGVWMANS